ncbi:hypothetical protein H0H92_014876 [Tricholoma furcatifolium]|nr:hypothetical protein H0H92_014876 [Tricholoma furcatifolium]
MPVSARSTPPPADVATFRDLLLFEERLKSNAKILQERKARYQPFLLAEVLLPPQISLLAIPYRMALQRILPDIYTPDVQVTVHPYFSTGLLFVSVTTLVLFFASGMYSEKISYANRYVPHANRSLRSFNMYLNVRKPPLRSKFGFNPLAFFFPRPVDPPSPSRPRTARSPSPPPGASVPIREIPPASNPRGELIFSSRVDKAFRDGYERHRAAFERRREEKEKECRRQKSWWRFVTWRWGRAVAPAVSATSSVASAGSTVRRTTPPIGSGIMMKQRDRSRSRSPVGEPEDRKSMKKDPSASMRTYTLERNMSQRNQSPGRASDGGVV